jgi:sugar/nucleoside kinase (ribokinase family)
MINGQRRGIIAGGNWIVDRLKFIDTYPPQDTLANILSEAVANGGSPFNLLLDLAKLGTGLPLAAIGLHGDDPDGEWIREQCAAYGIDSRQLRKVPGARTSYTDVMTVRATGRRTFFHQRGANALLDDSHFDFSLTNARHFHLGYLLLLDTLDRPDSRFGTVAARTLSRARDAGLKTSIDVVSEDSQRFSRVVLPALAYVDYCVLNEIELERTTGLAVRSRGVVDLGAVERAARRLLEAGVRGSVVVHFAEGACAIRRDGEVHRQGSLLVPQEKIVSAVGAGDAFAAGLLYALHEDAPMQVALHHGVCVAAASLLAAGASDGVVALQECLALRDQYSARTLES